MRRSSALLTVIALLFLAGVGHCTTTPDCAKDYFCPVGFVMQLDESVCNCCISSSRCSPASSFCSVQCAGTCNTNNECILNDAAPWQSTLAAVSALCLLPFLAL